MKTILYTVKASQQTDDGRIVARHSQSDLTEAQSRQVLAQYVKLGYMTRREVQ